MKHLNLYLFMMLILLLGLSLAIGSAQISIMNATQSLISGEDNIDKLILWEIRLPRSLAAVLVGAVLAFSGALLQSLFRNPLAEPGILGISSCASLGAVLALYFGLVSLGYFMLPLMAVVFTLLGIGFLFWVLRSDYSTDKIILAGMLMNALMAALMALVLNFAPSPFALHEIMHWLMGAVSRVSWKEVVMMLLVIIPVILTLTRFRHFLDAQVLGSDTAKSMGYEPKRYIPLILILLSIAVGTSVAFTGIIGFVGLIVPNMIRPWVGFTASRALLPSALLGAVLLLFADVLVRLVPSTVEIKLAVMIALLGTPLLLWFLYKHYYVVQYKS